MTERPASPSAEEHRQSAPPVVRCAVITVSDTRTASSDTSGRLIVECLERAGHPIIEHTIVPDEAHALRDTVLQYAESPEVDAILLTGGTGIAKRDQTPETIAALLTRELPGYGELFRMLSYEQIGAAAMLSRAAGGLIGETVVLTMPGSTAAVRLAMEKLILPELAHLVSMTRQAEEGK